ncbi:MAG TPA: 50S ribosomal protein L9 [Anaerolineales bacterium]|nr:50S ribosomal protein L9 [Anaerolineales bacterium]
MKVMLIKDVYKLGHAGDVKKVADGYGRNFLLPQGLAVIATAGALKQVEKIRKQAEIRRAKENAELQGLADQIKDVVLTFGAKAGDTGKLYGSVTTQDVAAALSEETRFEIKKHQVDMQPIRNLGEHTANIRLTVDLVPEIKIIVHREGEAIEEEVIEIEQPQVPVDETAVEASVEEDETEAEGETSAEAEVPAETEVETPAEADTEAEAADETAETKEA